MCQIDRAGTILRGRLAQLLTEGTSPNPRWLVKFDRQPQKDEEMYERSFGKLLVAYDEDEPSTRSRSPLPPAVQSKPSKPNGNAARRGSTGKNSSTSSDEEQKKSVKDNGSKKGSEVSEGSNAGSDDDSSTPETGSRRSSRDRVSAREERSRRRQAKIDEDVPGQESSGGKRRPPPLNGSKKRPRGENDGEVVKVKLLTGTLFLYRGLHRRAEFIRRV